MITIGVAIAYVNVTGDPVCSRGYDNTMTTYMCYYWN